MSEAWLEAVEPLAEMELALVDLRQTRDELRRELALVDDQAFELPEKLAVGQVLIRVHESLLARVFCALRDAPRAAKTVIALARRPANEIAAYRVSVCVWRDAGERAELCTSTRLPHASNEFVALGSIFNDSSHASAVRGDRVGVAFYGSTSISGGIHAVVSNRTRGRTSCANLRAALNVD